MNTEVNLPLELTPKSKQLFDPLMPVPQNLPCVQEALREGDFSADAIDKIRKRILNKS